MDEHTMTNDQLETLLAAVCVRCELPVNVPALVRGLPQRHAVQMSLKETANFVLEGWQSGKSETALLSRNTAGQTDKLRDDQP